MSILEGITANPSQKDIDVNIAGRLNKFLPEREKITKNSIVLNYIKGYELKFKKHVKQTWVSKRSHAEFEFLEILVIDKLLSIGGIEPCQLVDEQYILLFLTSG